MTPLKNLSEYQVEVWDTYHTAPGHTGFSQSGATLVRSLGQEKLCLQSPHAIQNLSLNSKFSK